jgi:hypothetical protein
MLTRGATRAVGHFLFLLDDQTSEGIKVAVLQNGTHQSGGIF